jgi:hypothetical protein
MRIKPTTQPCYQNIYIYSESFTRHELSAPLGTPLVDASCAYVKRTSGFRILGYNLPAAGSQGALSCDIGTVESAVFYTDGSLVEGSTGFAIHQTGVGGFGFKLSSPAGVYSAELSALFMALQHIREVMQKNA